mmetsp:Transcript_12674/g.33543  ORF Transcript_12674/g.33543 Transcript_12674/m.33543 type:complete len:88 (-) Transcript_12674:37-300(-)
MPAKTLPDRDDQNSVYFLNEFAEDKSFFRSYPYFTMRLFREPVHKIRRNGSYRRTEGKLETASENIWMAGEMKNENEAAMTPKSVMH